MVELRSIAPTPELFEWLMRRARTVAVLASVVRGESRTTSRAAQSFSSGRLPRISRRASARPQGITTIPAKASRNTYHVPDDARPVSL
jgi:hypothetical protein